MLASDERIKELIERRSDEIYERFHKLQQEFAERVMTTGFCAGKTSLVDGEPVFKIVEDFYER